MARTSFYQFPFDYAQGLIEFFYNTQFNGTLLLFLRKEKEIKDLLEKFEEIWKNGNL